MLSVLAGLYRRKIVSDTRVICVVGSFGKTTTTRAVTTALQREIHRRLSANCWSKLASALFRIRKHDRHAVIEAGIDDVGQMHQYARMIRPDITVVTSIGSEHNRSLGSLETTREEKAEMVKILTNSGLAVLNGDDPNVLWMAKLTKAKVITFGFAETNDLSASNVELEWPQGTKFRLHMNGEAHTVRSRLIGSHMVYPILAAIAVASAEGITLEKTLSALELLAPTYGRLEPVQLPNGAILLRDDYKSSLETVHAALDVFAGIDARRGIVMGEVSEPPGSQGPIYREIGNRIATIADYAVFVGGNFQRYAAGAREGGLEEAAMFNAKGSVLQAAECLRGEIEAGDTVLIKGRDTQRLERVALVMTGRKVRCDIGFCDARVVSCAECPMLERGWSGLRVIM